MVAFSDGGGEIYKADTIEHEGKMWLVPQWLEAPSEGWKIPERIVLLDSLPHQKTLGSSFGDFVLNSPIPKAVFDGPIQQLQGSGFVVVERPDIRIPIPRGIH